MRETRRFRISVWPTSVMYTMKLRWDAAGSKPEGGFNACSSAASAPATGVAHSRASGVGCMPCALRTNSGSPAMPRSLASCVDTAGWDMPSASAARPTPLAQHGDEDLQQPEVQLLQLDVPTHVARCRVDAGL